MTEEALKLKRQVRDFFNKNTNDEETIRKVAKAIGYIVKENNNAKHV